MNIARHLEYAALFFPDRPAVRQGGEERSYVRLNEEANRVATGLLASGLEPGDLVGLCAPNSADWIAFYFGVLKAGGVAVTLSSLLRGEELKKLVGHARPRFMFADGTKLHELEGLKTSGEVERIVAPGGDLDMARLMEKGTGSFKAMERERADRAAILYTGGTTGLPKGVVLTHQGITFSAYSIAFYERSTQADVALCFLPFNHVFGQMHILNSTVFSAGCLELLPTFDMDRVLDILAQGRLTKFFAVPTIYIRLLSLPDLKEKLGPLRYCFSAGAAMALEIVKRWKELTGITIAESYGMTECMPITFNHYYTGMHRAGSVGHPCHGVEVQIRDAAGNLIPQGERGEICARSPAVMQGYLDDPEATARDFWQGGWLRTGDVGVFDREGYLSIVDRLKDLVITGGENVHPREVEEVLYAWPAVEECAVVGLPDKEWGERLAAFIVPKAGCTVAPDEIKAFLKSRLSTFKVPKEYIVVGEMPKSPAGKILKRELKTAYVEGKET